MKKYQQAKDILRENNIQEVELAYKPKTLNLQLTKSKEVYDYILPYWKGINHYETFMVILVNRRNHILGHYTIGKGGISSTIADKSIIFQTVILANASGFFCVHNHPSGGIAPSESDIRLTKEIKLIAGAIPCSFLDHLIVTEHAYFSFSDDGIL